jgi:hypothetical protein
MRRARGLLLKRFHPSKLHKTHNSRSADMNGDESAAAQIGKGWSESPTAEREVMRSSMAVLVVISSGCLFVWGMAYLIQSLLEAELFVLRANLPFHP